MQKLFYKVYLEKQLINHPHTQQLLKRLKLTSSQPILIERLETVFNTVHKPYATKTKTLSLIIAEKRGQTVKPAPPAYGNKSSLREKHFYFIHAYNCIYSCEYCYLQGYFNSPDIVLFVNHDTILKELETHIAKTLSHSATPYFHHGEFSDSLALSHLSGELAIYFNFFKKHPHAYLELRTKSANISTLLEQAPQPNIITSFSIAPQHLITRYDKKTASLKTRLAAIKTLLDNGFPIALHLDPIIYTEHYLEHYHTLAVALRKVVGQNTHLLRHISLGTLRFAPNVWKQVNHNHPISTMTQEEWTATPGFDRKIRYPAPLRKWLLHNIKTILIKATLPADRIYYAME
ncbi:hypothetical protein COTS27_00665 [Spirochaetota bacterium]|nr:hypothetical protein COTS27_00665 [Spirochaetota bacterium]